MNATHDRDLACERKPVHSYLSWFPVTQFRCDMVIDRRLEL